MYTNNNYIQSKKFNQVNNPVVHDSVGVRVAGGAIGYNPERNVVWARDTKGPSMFDSPAHLGLVWGSTLQFQNAKGEDKFQKAHDLIEKMLSSGTNSRVKPGCNSAEIRQGNCPTVMQAYLDMKDTGLDNQGRADDDPVVLFRTEAKFNEQIQINNYLAWIKKNYGTTLTTSLRD